MLVTISISFPYESISFLNTVRRLSKSTAKRVVKKKRAARVKIGTWYIKNKVIINTVIIWA